MYPKGFPLKKKFDKYLFYLIRSRAFTNAVQNVLGKDYADYLQKGR